MAWQPREAAGAKYFEVRGFFASGEFARETVRADDARQAKRKLEERYRAMHLTFKAQRASQVKVSVK